MYTQPEIIYEDSNIVAVDKPAGILIHRTAKKEAEPTLVDWLLSRYPEIKNIGDDPVNRPGIVHRLDKDTSGIIVIPKNQETYDYLKHLFQDHRVKKTYLALVYGNVEPDRGIIDKPIGLKQGTTKRTIHGGKMVKGAVTEYRVLKKYGDFSLVEVNPRTGRTHQIRVHLASIGHPIVGDFLYAPKKAKKNSLGLKRQFLHAYEVELDLSDKTRLKLAAELPDDLTTVLKSI